jgi:hypothetical protein
MNTMATKSSTAMGTATTSIEGMRRKIGDTIGTIPDTISIDVDWDVKEPNLPTFNGVTIPINFDTGSSRAIESHLGGVIGSDTFPSRMVASNVLAFAPRLHRGLAADEYPAILQRGETVIPRGGSSTTTVNAPITIVQRPGENSQELAKRVGQELIALYRRDGHKLRAKTRRALGVA